MPVPDDAAEVLAAVRLGWCVAEVRGRNRPDAPPSPADRLPSRAGHPLPLQSERSPAEARFAAQAVLMALVEKLDVDAGTRADRVQGSGYAKKIADVARQLAELRKQGQEAAVAWEQFTGLVYTFDATVQDRLYARSDTQVCGY
jgi:hypothetical protein